MRRAPRRRLRRSRTLLQIMISVRSLWFVLFLHACCTGAAETLVSGTSEYPPYGFLRDGRVVGADTELVHSVVRLMGYAPDIRLLPWSRVELEAAQGRINLFLCDFAACDYYVRTQASHYPEFAALDYIARVIGEGRQFRVGFPRVRVDTSRDLRAARLQLLFDRALRALPQEARQGIRHRYGIGELPGP